ncbi:MAG: hypothetical protein Q9223_001889 [Gallowayella weberi]
MAFVQTYPSEAATPIGSRVNIVCVPAIGADPRVTWSTDPPDHHGVLQQLHRLLPLADIVLYDHLTPDERGIEVKAQKDAGHKSTAVAFAVAEERVARYGIQEWADRFLRAFWKQFQSNEASVVLHIADEWLIGVVKALSEKVDGGLPALVSSCIAIVFFGESDELTLPCSQMLIPREACPHHGSSVLSGPEYAQSIRGNLQLKWQMSEKLRQSLSLASEELRILNYNFAKAAIGIRIFSYIETRETELNVLSSSDASGEFLTRVHVCIVAERSAILNTAECSVEEEEVVGLNLKHTAFPRFQEEAFLCTNFAEKMAAFVRSLDAEERAAHAALVSSIVDGIRVDVHQFYEIGEQEATASMKVWSAQPSLRDFWKYGPDACLKQRLKKPETSHNPPLASIRRPRLEISPASEPIAPTITVAPALTTSVRKEEQTASDAPTEKPLPHISNPDPPLHIIEPSDRTGSLKPTGTATKSTLTHSPYNYPGGLLGPQDLPPSKSARSHARHPQGIMTPLSACNGIQLVLYLPYLHWDSFEQLRVRATTIKRRMRQENARPADHDIAMGQSLETKLIWQYLRSERPLHCRRTLDQYGYPSLRNTAVRDSDQILYKRTRADKDAEPPPLAMPKRPSHMDQLSVESDPLQDKPRDNEAKVLMVDQLWLWIVDEQTVVTFATPKEKEDDGGLSDQGDLRENIYKDVNGDYARRCSDPFDFAALVVFVYITQDKYPPNSLQTELQTRSFKDFRNNHRLRDPGDIDVRRLPKYVDNRSDLDALLELRDIEDELGTIHKLLKEQHSTVKDMLTYYKSFTAIKSSGAVGKNGILLLQTVDHNIKEYREQVDSMLNSARAAQTAFKELLDMKQKQANIVEAHLAREQTEVAADQSRSVMIFTIFTIIFLPLSFFASVFGINAREWSGESHNLGIHTIFVYMGSISLAVIIVALLVAFNKHTRRLAQRFWQMSAGPVQRMWMKGRERGARKQECEVEKKRLGQEASKPQRFNTLSVLTRQWTRMRWDEEAGIKALD